MSPSFAYEYLSQPVLASLLLNQKDTDSFFHPETHCHSGFAADGYAYTWGVRNQNLLASWATEGSGSTRGPLMGFPTRAVVLVSDACLYILDGNSQHLPLWMLFYMTDTNAYPNAPLGTANGYLTTEVSWANGLLTLNLVADPGSLVKAPMMLDIDFTQDRISVYTQGH